ncbi:putative serine/threonine-protein kinase DDB_G0280133 [Mytilus galloprovincialis]|uniref:Smad nuclear-interacting protein 1 n=1 Tax=Mytilus galloprovincialis TaxID=29158 RepID=A0A8B6EH47_MYTGA|nr:smad nuclear-interacting protein 1 [Mytilus galloprovincialis]
MAKDDETKAKKKHKKQRHRSSSPEKMKHEKHRHKSGSESPPKRVKRDHHRSPETQSKNVKKEREWSPHHYERAGYDRDHHHRPDNRHDHRHKRKYPDSDEEHGEPQRRHHHHHHRVKQERENSEMHDQRQERRHNDDRRRQARKQRGGNPFDQSENETFGTGREETNTEEEPKDKDKPDFELSGKLTEDTNSYKGVVIKYNQPPEARRPKKRWRLYPFKGEEALPVLHIHRSSAYLIGRERLVADIPIDHPSCSKQHAVLQYRLVEFERSDGTTGRRVCPYVIDLNSANGTFVNNQKIDPERYVELMEKDMVKFGFSSREYVLLHDKTDTSGLNDEGESD